MYVRMLWVAVAAAYVLPIAADGQTCTGFASFTEGALQVSGSALFNDNTKQFGGGFAFGSAGPFGQLSIGTASYDNFDGSSFLFGGGGGYEFKADAKGIVYLCPTAAVGFASGPNDIDVFGDGSLVVDLSETDLSFGISMGVVATQSGQTKIVPNASVSFVSATLKAKDQVSGASDSQSETFGLVGLGIGFIVNRVVTLHPGVSIPVGLEGASTSFGAAVSINFGAKR